MTISRLKMTANSTYWREDNPKNDCTISHGLLQKITQQKDAHSGVWGADPGGMRWLDGRAGMKGISGSLI